MTPPRGERRWFRALLRVGLGTKGIVYGLMGLLAVLAATGHGGQLGDKRQSIETLEALPGGRIILFLIATGLLGYVVLRVLQGLLDTDDRGTEPKGVLRRIGYVVNGLIYLGLVGYAFHSALSGRPGHSTSESEQSLTARVMSKPGGPFGVMFLGAFIIGIAGYQLYRAATGKFHDHVETRTLGDKRRAFVFRLGQFGYSARAIVIGIVGSFFVHAGHRARAAMVGSTGEAFGVLARVGTPLLAIVATGLMAYGAYAIVQAIYPVRQR